jgi:YVTN family beta-propeller protein
MKKLNKVFLALIISSAFFASCSNDDDNNTVEEPRGNYDGGLFIVNEGNNGKPNGTISYLSDDLKIENNVFTLVNTEKVTGDTPQNIGFNGDLAYLVVNGSNKVELVNRYTFKSIATISTGLKNPRFIAFANGKGYITNWGDPGDSDDDYVAVLDLATNSVTSKIPVVEGPEKIIENNGKLYVAHKGGWGQGNSLTVINSATNTVATNFVIGDVPSALVKDNGTLYVLCDGRPSYVDSETAGKIVKVSLSDNTITSTINFSDKTHPGFMDIENSKLYYTVGKNVYSAATSLTALPTTAIFTAKEVSTTYGFAVKNSKIYISDAVNYQDPGDIYVYSLTGTLTNDYSVGISPNGFYFNN